MDAEERRVRWIEQQIGLAKWLLLLNVGVAAFVAWLGLGPEGARLGGWLFVMFASPCLAGLGSVLWAKRLLAQLKPPEEDRP